VNRALPILALLLVALAAGSHLFRGLDADRGAAAVDPGRTPPEGSSVETGLPLVETSTPGPAPTTGPGPAAGTDAEGPAPPPQEEPAADPLELSWEERYAGLDVPALQAALAVLEERFERDRRQAVADHLTLGRYRTHRPGEPATEEPSEVPLITETLTGTNPETLEIEARIVSLAIDEHGALYALRDEIAWVQAKIGH